MNFRKLSIGGEFVTLEAGRFTADSVSSGQRLLGPDGLVESQYHCRAVEEAATESKSVALIFQGT